MFLSIVPLANLDLSQIVTFAQVLGASVGWVVAYRLLRESVRGNWGGAAPMLAVVIVAQFAAMPIMQHPLLRHAMPAFVALVVLIAIVGVRSTLRAATVAACLIAVMALSNAIATRDAAKVDEAAWRVSEDLLNSGVSLDQLDAGWGWFCYYHLHPGVPDSKGYQRRYQELRARARYSVGTQPPNSGEAQIREVEVRPVVGVPSKVIAVDRSPAGPSRPARGGVE
jgi:hypothetical protein